VVLLKGKEGGGANDVKNWVLSATEGIVGGKYLEVGGKGRLKV